MGLIWLLCAPFLIVNRQAEKRNKNSKRSCSSSCGTSFVGCRPAGAEDSGPYLFGRIREMAEFMGQSRTWRKLLLGTVGMVVLALSGLWLIDPDAFPVGTTTDAEQPAPALPSEYGFPPTSDSDAERIARLQRSIDEQRKYLEKLNAQLHDPDSEYSKAEKRFQQVDAEREQVRREIRELKSAGKIAEAASS